MLSPLALYLNIQSEAIQHQYVLHTHIEAKATLIYKQESCCLVLASHLANLEHLVQKPFISAIVLLASANILTTQRT